MLTCRSILYTLLEVRARATLRSILYALHGMLYLTDLLVVTPVNTALNEDCEQALHKPPVILTV